MTQLNSFLEITHSHAEFRNPYKSNPLVGDFLKLNEANVLNRLIDLYVYNDGKSFLIFNTTLATALDCTTRTITNYYRRLKELGYITISARTISDGKTIKKYNFITVNFPKLFQDFGKKLFQDQMPKTISFIWRIIQKAKILYRKIFQIKETTDFKQYIKPMIFCNLSSEDSLKHENHQLCDEEEDKIPIEDYYHWRDDMEICKKWVQIAETDYQFLIEHTNDAYYKFCKFYTNDGKGARLVDTHCGWKVRWDKWLLNTHKTKYRVPVKAGYGVKTDIKSIESSNTLTYYEDNDINVLIEKLDESAESKDIKRKLANTYGRLEYLTNFHIKASFVKKDGELCIVADGMNTASVWEDLARDKENYAWLKRQSDSQLCIVFGGLSEFLKGKI